MDLKNVKSRAYHKAMQEGKAKGLDIESCKEMARKAHKSAAEP